MIVYLILIFIGGTGGGEGGDNARTTLATSIYKDIASSDKKNNPTVIPVKQFKSTKDLEDLRMLAQERDVWKEFLNVIYST